MTSGIFEIAVIFVLAALLGAAARVFRQPVILAYLLAGVIAAHFNFFNFANREVFGVFSDLGIMLLLFLVGLEINYTALRHVGTTVLLAGASQVVVTSSLGFLLGRLFNFSPIASLYLGIALAFSSTIIIIRLLSEKKDLNSLYGKLSVGILLVQDLFAVSILVFLDSASLGKNFTPLAIPFFMLGGVALLGFMIWLGRTVMPKLLDRVAHSSELLFLGSLAWVFVVSALLNKLGFSLAIGGFLSGIALANSAEHFEIASRVRPLRDFFMLVFFVILGSSLVFSNIGSFIGPLIIFSLFVLIINPLILCLIMGIMGYRKQTSFMTALTMAQVSEFSLVLIALAARIGHVGETEVGLVTSVAVVTIILSTYLVMYSREIFRYLSPMLSIFERKKKVREDLIIFEETSKPIILAGFARIGQSIALDLPDEDLLVIDFNPEIVNRLKHQGIAAMLADLGDIGIIEKLNLEATRLFISTVPDLENNLTALAYLTRLRRRPKIIMRAENENDAEKLYEKGADYVLLPHFTSGQYLGKTIAADLNLKLLTKLKKGDLELMKRWKKSFGVERD